MCQSDDVCTITVQPCVFQNAEWYIAVAPVAFTKSKIQFALEVSDNGMFVS